MNRRGVAGGLGLSPVNWKMTTDEFKILADRLRPRIVALAKGFFRRVRIPEDAEDVAQEVLMRLWLAADVSVPVNPEAWAVRVTKNICVSRWRKTSVRGTVDIDGERGLLSGESASERVEELELRRIAERELDALPSATRRVIEMRSVHGMGLDEIAAVTGRPKTSIKTVISGARRRITDKLMNI